MMHRLKFPATCDQRVWRRNERRSPLLDESQVQFDADLETGQPLSCNKAVVYGMSVVRIASGKADRPLQYGKG